MTDLAILGAGMAGFGAAHRFQEEGLSPIIYEKHAYPGGHAASHRSDRGFVFDEGPHISFTSDERIKSLFAESVDHEYFEGKVYVNNYWQGRWIKHPAQCNLYGLPHDLIVKILRDFFDAQYNPPASIANYEDWLVASFGQTFAETFPEQYTLKYHTTAAKNMSTDWIGPRIHKANVDEVLLGAISPDVPDVHYVTGFRYPKRGGFASFLRKFISKTTVRPGHEVVSIDTAKRAIAFTNGHVDTYEHLVSSMPLPELIRVIRDVPADVREAAGKLACSEVVIVTLGIGREDLSEAHWTYFYDHDIITTRLSTPHMQSVNNVPPGCGSFQAEIYFSKKYRPLTASPDSFIDPVIADLRRVGLLREDDEILLRHAMHLPYANVIFDLDRTSALAKVHGFLDDIGIRYCGRYGEWAYIWTDQSFKSGEAAAQRVLDSIGRVRKT